MRSQGSFIFAAVSTAALFACSAPSNEEVGSAGTGPDGGSQDVITSDGTLPATSPPSGTNGVGAVDQPPPSTAPQPQTGGQMTGVGGTPSVDLGSGGAASSGGTSSGGSFGSGGQGSGGMANHVPCEYPAGPYESLRRLEVGDVLPPDLSWPGYDLDGNWRTVTSEELLDCDGSQGRNAIVLRNAAIWCGVCESMANKLNDQLDAGLRDDGVAFYVLLTEDAQRNDITEAGVRNYFDVKQPDGWGLLVDPDWTVMKVSGGGSLPFQIVVDPRTMKIEAITKGRADVPNGLNEVLGRNL